LLAQYRAQIAARLVKDNSLRLVQGLEGIVEILIRLIESVVILGPKRISRLCGNDYEKVMF
jgi:hypothetical protein